MIPSTRNILRFLIAPLILVTLFSFEEADPKPKVLVFSKTEGFSMNLSTLARKLLKRWPGKGI